MTKKEAIARIKDHISVHKEYEEKTIKIIEALNIALSVLEETEIISCCECKYWKQQADYDFGLCENDSMWQHTNSCFYCGYAKKRGE